MGCFLLHVGRDLGAGSVEHGCLEMRAADVGKTFSMPQEPVQALVAAAKAKDILEASCPTEMPATPLARLSAMEQRLQTISAAIATVLSGPDAA